MDSFIAEHLKGVSRTYAVVVPLLPAPLADAVGLAYLVFRVIDTIEDAPGLSDDERRARLTLVSRALDGDAGAAAALAAPLGELEAERSLMVDAPAVLERVASIEPAYRAALRTSAQTMIDGVGALLDRAEQRSRPYPAVQDENELREYCYYVAGTVGEMLCAMFARYLRLPGLTSLRELAVELGIGLQLVNILKDFRDDEHHGRRYLPIVADHVTSMDVYRAVLRGAQASLKHGVEFVLALPHTAAGVRRFCGLPIAWGALTLSGSGRGEAGKMSRADLRQSMDAFDARVADDGELRSWLLGLLGTDAPPTSAPV